MGCDSAVLVSDRKFAGSDTWATSYTLSQAIKKMAKRKLKKVRLYLIFIMALRLPAKIVTHQLKKGVNNLSTIWYC